jgi:hypothetical protein
MCAFILACTLAACGGGGGESGVGATAGNAAPVVQKSDAAAPADKPDVHYAP